MPEVPRLSLNQRRGLAEEVRPLLAPYFEHQGWPSLAAADTATDVLVQLLRDMGVRL